MRILIFGAGRVGAMLLRSLEAKRDCRVTVVDGRKDVCEGIAATSSATVVCGDATDPGLLDELKLGGADFVFAVTGNEEVNFLASVYAKHAGCRRVISRAGEPKYSKLMEKLGIEPLIPENTLARELANMVVSPVICKMLDPDYSHIELLEMAVERDLEGRQVQEAQKKRGFRVIAVYDGAKFIPVEGATVLGKGMKIVVLRHNP